LTDFEQFFVVHQKDHEDCRMQLQVVVIFYKIKQIRKK